MKRVKTTAKGEIHDLHDFVRQSQQLIEEEYKRIQKHAKEDPGTAGDQGEENWRQILEQWLPPYFSVVTKGKILFASGYRSPQVDVLILRPSYPPILKNRKDFLAEGVAAAFECKTTLKAHHIREAIETCNEIKKAEPLRFGSPFKELCSDIVYGVLAHSHSWKNPMSQPADNISKALLEEDLKIVQSPKHSLDVLCVADLGLWHTFRMSYAGPLFQPLSELMRERYGEDGKVLSGFLRSVVGEERQEKYFAPIGSLLAGLTNRLAWRYEDLRGISTYFYQTGLGGIGTGCQRMWDLSIYSDEVQRGIRNGLLKNGFKYDEWSLGF